MKIPKKRVLGLVAIALVISACSDSGATRDEQGEIVEEGRLSAFSMQVGDCILEPTTDEIASLDAVPCAQAHDYEVYATFDMPTGDYPGQAAVDEAIESQCPVLFKSAIGVSYESSIYYMDALYPTLESWTQGDDREIVCVVLDINGQTTGSLLGIGQ